MADLLLFDTTVLIDLLRDDPRIGLPDCLIAATAMRRALPVVTLNDRHFRLFKGLKVIRPY